MKRIVKRVVLVILAVAVVVAASFAIFAYVQVRNFDASMAKVYDVPPLAITISTDEAVLARGKHLVESVAPCATRDCHGSDLAGGTNIDVGPIGNFCGPNISAGGLGATYTDGELARLVRHGVKKDGRSVRFMPAHEFGFLPDSDLTAAISYLRTMPPVDRPNALMTIKWFGKFIDRMDGIPLDIARRIDHEHPEVWTGPPEPTAKYGRLLARSCTGCHGKKFSGGPIPGAPASMPKPLNLTPHETGLKDWTFDDFDKLLSTGVRKNGSALNPFMPLDAIGRLDPIERRALWEYLRTLPPVPLGNR
ncbi:MAG TPA: c-type cytochrome [Labilithrix sp.]|jgi:hypothetical protein